MRKSIFLSLILCLFLPMCIPQAMAQKQSRMEKLIRYLYDNDLDKWQKSREKLDEETQAYYAADLSLMDTLNVLWNKRNEQAATHYFGLYERAAKSYFPAICEDANIQLSALRNRTDNSIIDLLESSTNKIPFSRALIDSILITDYPIDSTQFQRLKNTRELALMDGMLKSPTLRMYQTYLAEYPNGKFIPQIRSAENARLFQLVKNTPTDENFKAFFEDTDMLKFFKDPASRPYIAEVRAMYDDVLFQQIDSMKKDGNATAIRQYIDNYKNTAYLTPANRKYLNNLEFLSEKADFELLKPAIVSSESLNLLKDFLMTHKYKVFRDSANALRTPFIVQAIVSTPNTVKYYNQGRLIKYCETDSTGNTSTTYTYNDKGQVTSILSLTEKNGLTSNEVQTSMLYNPQGQCIFEVKTNPKTKVDFYHRTRRFAADGSLENDSLKYTDGRLTLGIYNKAGQLLESKDFKNGELQAYTVNKYDEKGRLMESQRQNLLFINSPNQMLSQKEVYQYDKYGYLTRIAYQRISGNNQKTAGFLTYMYDEYGNRIDGNSYYEYDNTGQWICRTNDSNPQEVERIQYIYK